MEVEPPSRRWVMRGKSLRAKIFLVLILVCLVGSTILFLIPTAKAGFEEDFNRANDWDSYRGDVGHKNARLIQNVTAVIHEENLEILRQIEELKAELSKLKGMMEE